jgi:mannose-6-phosphate isomerase-like protein (cupin superfamily)
MKPSELMASGLLELYVMGQTSDGETVLIEQMATEHPEIKAEIEMISITVETWAMKNAIEPDPTIKPFLMATLRYIARLEKGELATVAPQLSKESRKEDFSTWLDREDLQLEGELKDFYAHIISGNERGTTAIVWIKNMAPPEEHDKEFERFLILEGSCDIVIEGTPHHLSAGDFMEIPLFKNHHVLVTSETPCKVILQRMAA